MTRDDMGVELMMRVKDLLLVRAALELASMKLEDGDYKERLFARGKSGLADSVDKLTLKLPRMLTEVDKVIKRAELVTRKQEELSKELECLDDDNF